jgi:hypothetical protein
MTVHDLQRLCHTLVDRKACFWFTTVRTEKHVCLSTLSLTLLHCKVRMRERRGGGAAGV